MDRGAQRSDRRDAGTRPISVIVAAKDAEATIGRAVRSALIQPECREVLVVDDGSTDATSAAARSAYDGSGRVRMFRLDRNRGPSAARNLALANATGPLVAILDADDYMLPGRFGRMLAALAENDIIADDLLIADEAAEPAEFGRLAGETSRLPTTLDLATFVYGNIRGRLERRELGFLKPIMRHDFLAAHRLTYDETVRLGEDYLLYARALACGARFRVIEPCGYVAVQNPHSLSRNHGIAELEALLHGCTKLFGIPGLSADAVRALRRHHQHVFHKIVYRRLLEAKRNGDYARALAIIAGKPSITAAVLRQILEDRRKGEHTTRMRAGAGAGSETSPAAHLDRANPPPREETFARLSKETENLRIS